jgi:Zn-dependent protease
MRSIGIPVIPFGWAKPVPIDVYNLKDRKRDSALISLAGPFVNIALATVLAIVVRSVGGEMIFNLLYPVILLNVALAVFNLIPVHPLDGGKVLVGLLPDSVSRDVDSFLNSYGMFLLLILIFPFGGGSLITSVIEPVVRAVITLLLPGASLI